MAHPHVFVDTSLRFEVNDVGEVTHVNVTWSYDDFFSLLIFEDMGLDQDADGTLTEAELAQLKGFDLVEWPDGFEGDLYLYHEGRKIGMTLPEPTGIAVENGRIVASHRRAVDAVPVHGLEIHQYDPTYYVAYELTGGVIVPGGCATRVVTPDPDAAAQAVSAELDSVPEDQFEVMQIGIHYAHRAFVTCKTGS